MGWFWNDVSPTTTSQIAPHPMPRESNLAPPPECPMHQKSATVLQTPPKTESACPYTPNDVTKSEDNVEPPTKSLLSKFNPLNYMFASISQERAENQKVDLDTEREPSTIPKGTGDGNWEYPSPQQMYNALLRKGYHDTNPEHVTSMVSVHNFLNEGAWNEIRVHEGLFHKGLFDGWTKMEKGEAGIDPAVADEADPKLMRFQGRPKDMTPKAAMWQVMSWVYPSRFKTEPPFDRHDWYVERKVGNTTKQVRYVIDYYDGAEDDSGEPVFYLDVRPAIDSPTLAMERALRWGSDVWYRAAGVSARTATAGKS